MTIARVVLAAAAVTIPVLAHAADPALPPSLVRAPEIAASESLYVALRGGYNILERTGYGIDSATPGLPSATVSTEYRGGYSFSAAVGYDMGEVFDNVSNRIEFEIGATANRVRRQQVTTLTALNLPAVGLTETNVSGQTTTVYGMLNYFLDWNLGRFRPFVGAGIGLASSNFERHATGSLGKIMDDGDVSVAWSLMAGVGFQLSSSMTIEVAYRYLRADDINLSTADRGQPGFTLSSTTNVKNSQILLGARLRF